MKPETLIIANALVQTLGTDVPEWIEIMPLGQVRLADGRKPLSLVDVSKVIARSFDGDTKLLIDVDHGTQESTNSAAAGWITELAARDGKLVARVEWTSRGRELVADQTYRRISPTFMATKRGRRVTRIIGASLVNNPAIPELKPLTAAMEETMDLTKLAELLGLEADASLEEIQTAAEKMAKTNKGLAGRLVTIGEAAGVDDVTADGAVEQICAALESDDGDDPDPAKFVPIAAFNELKGEVASLRKTAAQGRAEALVTAAVESGKVTPALKDWATSYATKDPDGFAAWAADAPELVTAGRKLSVKPPAKEAGALDEQELAIAAACGVTGDAFAKTRETLETAASRRQEG